MKQTQKPQFSIKWQAFGLTSLVLAVLFVFVLLVLTNATSSQFNVAMNTIFERNQKQFQALLDVEGQKISQLSLFTARNQGLAKLLATENSQSIENALSDLSWNLQIEYGIDKVMLYDAQGFELSTTAEMNEQIFAQSILRKEQHDWRLQCNAQCYVVAGAPILYEGDVVGVVALSEPLTNVLLKFYQINEINTALLSERYERYTYVEHLPEWSHNLVALTNPSLTRDIIDLALADLRFSDLSAKENFIEVNDRTYHMRSFELGENTLLTIRDVSEGKAIVEHTLANMRWMLMICLIVAECLLLLVLWRPMTRLRRTTNILPSLASRNYAQAKKDFDKLGASRFVNDEADILRITASGLCDELESMREQLETRASELEKRGRELELERDFVNQLFNTMHAAIIIQDGDGYIRQTNHYTQSITGFSQEKLNGMHFAKLLDPSENFDDIIKHVKDISQSDSGEFQHEAAVITHDQHLRFLAWRHAPLINQKTGSRQVLSIAVDISGRIEAETELAWLARHDTLSGLHNRHAFEEELAKRFANFHDNSHQFGVMFVDLDDFKSINDTYGHHKGDEMIRAVANTLKDCSRDTDFVARMGGDEFALIVRNFHRYDLERIAERMLEQLSSIVLEPQIHCSASIGVAVHSALIPSPDVLISDADTAMYAAKEAGKNRYVIFQDDKHRIDS
ncbi:MAG: diguanylate cyclase [Oleiphilaceae bacterium]|nr:diguanylate cyclase [Oleiphilaceae bacterium]